MAKSMRAILAEIKSPAYIEYQRVYREAGDVWMEALAKYPVGSKEREEATQVYENTMYAARKRYEETK